MYMGITYVFLIQIKIDEREFFLQAGFTFLFFFYEQVEYICVTMRLAIDAKCIGDTPYA